MTTLSAKYKNKIQYTPMRTHFLLFDVGIARLTFQIRPHQCFDIPMLLYKELSNSFLKRLKSLKIIENNLMIKIQEVLE